MTRQYITTDGDTVTMFECELSRDDADRIVRELKEESPPMHIIRNIEVRQSKEGRYIVDYDLEPPKFERIRRITGYLVGTMDRWNDSKKHEERERVKHEINK